MTMHDHGAWEQQLFFQTQLAISRVSVGAGTEAETDTGERPVQTSGLERPKLESGGEPDRKTEASGLKEEELVPKFLHRATRRCDKKEN